MANAEYVSIELRRLNRPVKAWAEMGSDPIRDFCSEVLIVGTLNCLELTADPDGIERSYTDLSDLEITNHTGGLATSILNVLFNGALIPIWLAVNI